MRLISTVASLSSLLVAGLSVIPSAEAQTAQPYPAQPYPGGQPYPGAQPYQGQPYQPPQQYPPQQQPGAQPYPPQQQPGAQPYPPQQQPGAQPYPPQQYPGAPAAPAPAAAPAQASFDMSLGGAVKPTSEPPAPADEREERNQSLGEQNSISGSTGLLRLLSAGSGAPGTLRMHILGDWFSTSGFLCNTDNPCATGNTGIKQGTSDSASHFGASIGISVTPVSFLEAYASLRSYSNSNDQNRPELLQVLGDTTLGLKAFTPNKLGQIFNFGGAADLILLNGAGGVGLDGSATSARLRALSTLDFRQPGGEGAPLRLHVNVGYLFDNSAKVVASTEQMRAQFNDVRGPKITRVERFGLGINRVDQFMWGIGVEGTFPMVRPFVEFNMGIPANRQGYACDTRSPSLGDNCLLNAGASAWPSTLTLGLRLFPWLRGMQATVAFDIGTSGTKTFMEEMAPTPPWNLWLGAGFAFDTVEPPATKVVTVEKASAPSPDRKIRGFVHEKGKPDPVPDAIVRFQGRNITGLVTGPDGRFLSGGVEPGNYTLAIQADGFADGLCQVTVLPRGAAQPPAPAPQPGQAPPYGYQPGAPMPYGYQPGAPAPQPAPAPMPGAGQPGSMPPAGAPPPASSLFTVDVDCPLEAGPRTGSVSGRILDADKMTPVEGASVKVADMAGKEFVVAVAAGGTFRGDALPAGPVTLKAEAPDYVPSQRTVDIKPQQDIPVDVTLRKRASSGDVEVSANEIKIKKQIHFETNSAKINPDSTALVEEIADVINRTTRIKRVEIQGHTDNTGGKDHNKTLSDQRANAVRESLIALGVDAGRLVAVGYGQEKPLSPNATPQGRERNRRVQFMIVDQDKAGGAAKPAAKKTGAGGATTAKPKPKAALPF